MWDAWRVRRRIACDIAWRRLMQWGSHLEVVQQREQVHGGLRGGRSLVLHAVAVTGGVARHGASKHGAASNPISETLVLGERLRVERAKALHTMPTAPPVDRCQHHHGMAPSHALARWGLRRWQHVPAAGEVEHGRTAL